MGNEDENGKKMTSSWGSLEELLLACAVKRHGKESWDSVAKEIQSRSSNFTSLSTIDCEEKYNELKRRFEKSESDKDLEALVDELRRIRVEELKRDIQHSDISIMELQLKIVRLKEEHEQSTMEMEKEEEDPKNDIHEEMGASGEQNEASPDKLIGKPVSGDDSDSRSYNESRLVIDCPVKSDLDISINAEGVTLKIKQEAVMAIEAGASIDCATAPVAELKLGETKDICGMQSSAYLSRDERQRIGNFSVGAEGNSNGDNQAKHGEISMAVKEDNPVLGSGPLVRVLEIIRSHRLGSVFEQRIRSQDTRRYEKLIRQHMDLEIVQSKLDKGMYTNCMEMFFRDLLLLFNNAIIFFSKNSTESLAANQLRTLVSEEMIKFIPRFKSTSYNNKKSSIVKINDDENDEACLNVEEEEKKKKKLRGKWTSVGGRSCGQKKSQKVEDIIRKCGGNELSSHDDLNEKIGDKQRDKTRKIRHGAPGFLSGLKQKSLLDDGVVMVDVDDGNDWEDSKDEEKKIRRSKRIEERRQKVSTRRRSGDAGGGSDGGEREAEDGNVKTIGTVGMPPKRELVLAMPAQVKGAWEVGSSRKRGRGRR